jgi:hypothetical protein
MYRPEHWGSITSSDPQNAALCGALGRLRIINRRPKSMGANGLRIPNAFMGQNITVRISDSLN